MSEEQHAAALLTLLNAALAPKVAYDVDEIPVTRPPEYVEVMVARRFGATSRNSGWQATTGWRVTLRFVSQTSVSNARAMREKCRAALEFVALNVAGALTTPADFETSVEIGPDAGWFSGLDSYTYQL